MVSQRTDNWSPERYRVRVQGASAGRRTRIGAPFSFPGTTYMKAKARLLGYADGICAPRCAGQEVGDMARVKKSRESRESAPLGRVIAVLRAALDLTQSDLARLSGVKRSSISEYERGKSTPDAVTLERLLAAMRFRWTALDLGDWFVERLLSDCRVPEGEDVRGGAEPLLVTASALATRLSADVVAASQTAARLSKLVLTLQERRTEASPPETGPASPARDRNAERRAAQALWTRMRALPRKEQM